LAKKARSKSKPAARKKTAKSAARKTAAKPRPKGRAKKPATKPAIKAAVPRVKRPPRTASGGPPTVGLNIGDDPYLRAGNYTFSPSGWRISSSACDQLTGFASGDATLMFTAKYKREPDPDDQA
jgi:hypothetical protein